VRITPFTVPAGLDHWLDEQGWTRHDDTRVMVCPAIATFATIPLPTGTQWDRLDSVGYAQAIGQLRGTPPGQIEAHTQRLAASPVPYQGFAIRCSSDGSVLACGQLAREAELVGLYDIHTRADARQQGLANIVCERLLSLSALEGATVAYLQVESGNEPALRLYHRLGFADAYTYHYRRPV